VNKVPSGIEKLKPGMNREDVLSALGLAPYANSTKMGFAPGMGSLNQHQTTYELRDGYQLTLVFDRTAKEEKFKKAILVGEGWTSRK
jgi:hypothetical protein